jgi:hypothetical protein
MYIYLISKGSNQSVLHFQFIALLVLLQYVTLLKCQYNQLRNATLRLLAHS